MRSMNTGKHQSQRAVAVEKSGFFELATLGIPVALYLSIRFLSTMEPGDDAYMTLRFVSNLLAGRGYVYNPGEPILGTTALYPLLLALVCKLFGSDPIAAGRYFLLPFEVGNLFLVWFFGRRATGQPLVGMIAALLFATSPYLLSATLTYMEAPLFAFLILASCASFLLSDSPTWRALSWIFAGLALICRPEGGILFLALGLGYFLYRGKLRWSDLVWSGLILVPWGAWTSWQFGGPIPTSMTAKRLAYVPYPHQSLAWLLKQIGRAFEFSVVPAQIERSHIAFNLLLLAFGAMSIVGSIPALFPLLFFALTFWALYALANPFIFPWYLVPLEAPLYLAISVALFRIAHLISAALLPRLSWGDKAIFLLLFVPMLSARLAEFNGKVCDGTACHKQALAFAMPGINPRSGLNYEREGWYLNVVDDLRGHVDASTRILTSEFGVIGYFLPCHMISSLGHVNPEVLPYLPAPLDETDYPTINHAISVALVKALLPEYVISPEIFIRKSLLTSDWFAEQYSTEKIYPFGVYNYGELYVFKRRTPGR